jgi:hypothetical protein
MSARSFALAVIESSYGTAKTTPVAGTDSTYLRLSGDTNPDVRFKPKLGKIPYGGGVAVNALTYADTYELTGKLKTELYPSQAAILLPWCMVPVNTGRTTPWATTDTPGVMPVGDLASMSLYHAIQRADATYLRKQNAGMKVHTWKLSASRDNPVWTLELDLVGIKEIGNAIDASTDPDVTAFPAPTEAAYPNNPFLFSQSALTIGGARTAIESITITGTNKMDPRPYEKRYLTLDRYLGRDVTLEAELLYKASPDDRATFKAVTSVTASLVLTNGSNSVTINLNSANFFDDVTDQLPNEKTYDQTVKLATNWDATALTGAGADLTLTVV